MSVGTIVGVKIEQVQGAGADNRCALVLTTNQECGREPVALLYAGRKSVPICRDCCAQLSSILGDIARRS